ncbi:hypothetical protein V5O48_006360 [Marasmius crinis-equi]|uniref:Uncharacterized protein n=1 Tax=Marasmius crinis-equi TaxID=585013 RepID=A0ABR3FJR6_9AGAR
MYFIYGLYVLIFSLCMRALLRRKEFQELKNRNLFLIWTVTLFTIVTVSNVIVTWSLVRQAIIDFVATRTQEYMELLDYLHHDKFKTAHTSVTTTLAVLINLVAESMLASVFIHRCYIIWNFKRRIAYPLAFMSVALNVFGLIISAISMTGLSNTSDPRKKALFVRSTTILNGYRLASLGLNFLITLLTAGRIWVISRQARALMGREIDRRYKTIIAILLESGIMYPLATLLWVILEFVVDPESKGIVPIDTSVDITQFAGIAPTLVIVRAAYGRTIDNVDQAISTLRFGEGEATSRSRHPTDFRTLDLDGHEDTPDASRVEKRSAV